MNASWTLIGCSIILVFLFIYIRYSQKNMHVRTMDVAKKCTYSPVDNGLTCPAYMYTGGNGVADFASKYNIEIKYNKDSSFINLSLYPNSSYFSYFTVESRTLPYINIETKYPFGLILKRNVMRKYLPKQTVTSRWDAGPYKLKLPISIKKPMLNIIQFSLDRFLKSVGYTD